MNLWGGRFKESLDSKAYSFNQSLSFDKRLIFVDILGSISHAKMLGKQNIIPKEDSDKIIENLNIIKDEIENGKIEVCGDYEDVHSFVESELIKRIGDVGKKLHTARSRNDQVALDMKLYTRETMNSTIKNINELLSSINSIIEKNKQTILPGFTHLQKAQPITLSHYFKCYREMFKRDLSRLFETLDRLNECPLGACALAGTVYPIDRDFVSNDLQFKKPTENSIDSVSDRDYLIEYIFDLSLTMLHLSRLSEEIIIYNSNDYNYITTGSSIMPQKKNPDIAELIRGKTGRVYGALIQLLTTFKSLPLSYNKDMQEDKEFSFDAMDTANACIKEMSNMLKNITFNKEVMKNSCLKGFINATDVADYLVKKNIPFRDAHKMVGELILLAEEKNLTLSDLPLDDYNRICNNLVTHDIYEKISIETSVKDRKSKGGTGEDL